MVPFYEQMLQALRNGERFALATVVHTIGSTPQKTGARALFYADGRIAGTLGGGCMEAEARRRALQSLGRGEPFHFTLQLDQDFGWDDGLICGGSATILVEPGAGHYVPILEELEVSVGRGERAVLAMFFETDGVPPATSVLFRSDGPSVGGALPESIAGAVVDRARNLMEAPWQEPRAVAVAEGSGRVYMEPHAPLPGLLIVGGGHVGAALAALASRLDFAVTVLDDRASFLYPERFPAGTRLLVEEIAAGIRAHPLRRDSFVVIVTRGHQHDAEALREVIGSPAAYIGMIGSRRKVHVIFQGLIEDGLATSEQLRRVRSPIGLDIGGRSVEEIAVSIAAEMVAVRSRIRAGADPLALVPEGEAVRPMAAQRSPRSLADPEQGGGYGKAAVGVLSTEGTEDTEKPPFDVWKV